MADTHTETQTWTQTHLSGLNLPLTCILERWCMYVYMALNPKP